VSGPARPATSSPGTPDGDGSALTHGAEELRPIPPPRRRAADEVHRAGDAAPDVRRRGDSRAV